MRWYYFKTIRNLDVAHFFKKKGISKKLEIEDYLIKNNFTFSKEELNNIYDSVKPETEKIAKEEKRVKAVLPQKKKNIRRSNKRKTVRNVSGSVDARRKS